MKKFFITLTILTLVPNIAEGQNRLSNGSFEIGNRDPSKNAAENLNDNLVDWESREWIGPTIHWHSPDWLWHPTFTPYGDNYIGMTDYELFQQKLSSSNKLENNTPYLITFYIKIGAYADHDHSLLNLYIAENKIKYKKESLIIGQDEEDHFCSEDYKTHKSFLNSIIKIES
ncbi:unnamed protein product, partial [marine sediment metagenome]